jgi:putative ABC transport system ATP-binding protein
VALTPVLEAANLYRFFHAGDDEVLALRGVSLLVRSSEMVAVVGPSGSGKSTLLACMCGLDEPDGGTVRVAGEVMTRRPEPRRAELRARNIGVLSQADNLFEHLDIDANVGLSQRLAGRDQPAWRAELLERLGIAHRAHSLPSQLSGGEAVRAGLAVALANDPPLIVADEPTGEIDDASEADVLALFADERRKGRALIVATHSEGVAAAASRVVRLIDGEVAE